MDQGVPYVVIAEPGDLLAEEVAQSLKRAHGPGAVASFTMGELALARWAYRHESEGPEAVVRTSDGRVVDRPRAVLNRIVQVDVPQFAFGSVADRHYALMETNALLLAWLSGASGRVINPASPRGVGGAMRSAAEWLLLAARAGLPTQSYEFVSDPRLSPVMGRSEIRLHGGRSRGPLVRQSPVGEGKTSVFVAGDVALGEESLAPGCLRLAKLVGTPLIRCLFGRDPQGEWVVTDVESMPVASADPGVRAEEVRSVTALMEAA